MTYATKDGLRPPLDWSQVRRVLLVRLRSIGDTVLMTPCLAAIKSLRADIETAVLSEPLSAPVLEGHPLVDDLIVAPRELAQRARLVLSLRRKKFDAAFNMHGGTTATLIAATSGARYTIGYRDYNLSWLLNRRAPPPDAILGRAMLHSVEQQLALLHWSGVRWPARPQLSIAVAAEARTSVRARLAAISEADASLSEGRFAVIAPAAAFESKRWPVEGFAAVADYLREKHGLRSIIIAGPGQERVAEQLRSLAPSSASVVTGLSLKELAALIDQAAVFVGNDSGPTHMAAALARPIVVVFGSSNATVWRPWTDSPYRVVASRAASERPSSGAGFWPPADEVIAAAEHVLKAAAAANREAGAPLRVDARN